jgi:hypothetical protein
MAALLPLWRRIAASAAAEGKFKAIDVAKARLCTCFIGFGAAGSYTEHYREAAGELANCGNYKSTDWVMVSCNGQRDDRYSPLGANGRLRSIYAEQLALVAEAGATVVADTLAARSNGYNIGELELAEALSKELGFIEEPPDSGVWRQDLAATAGAGATPRL